MVKIKHYLVDSENVNDNWLMLLDMAGENDEIIIFYTKNSLIWHIPRSLSCYRKIARFNLKSALRDRMPWFPAHILSGISDWNG